MSQDLPALSSGGLPADPVGNSMDRLEFSNRFIHALPGDPVRENYRRQVRGACWSSVFPTPGAAPECLAWSPEIAADLGIDPDDCRSRVFAEVFGGNRLLPGMQPFAMCYGGHQFGAWAGQLGDGRAINLGEVRVRDGFRTLQLKGAGPTPYSRTADGLAVLRSSIREFLCSEAMHHLGIPTTRALSLVSTGDRVRRDMFYDGNPKQEPGAVVCRVSSSFIRFGSFQIHAAHDSEEVLSQLIDYTIRCDYPHLGEPSAEVRLNWFREVVRRTVELIVGWMRVGFVHGVMNTDNMSIIGETIDYGPYGWLDNYDPQWTPNTTDAQGRRYRFGNQPAVAQWNLYQLANALVPAFRETEGLQDALNEFTELYDQCFEQMMSSKLGLQDFRAETDQALIEELLSLLQVAETDMTLFFRGLSSPGGQVPLADSPNAGSGGNALPMFLRHALYRPETLTPAEVERWQQWFAAYHRRLEADGAHPEDRRARMNRVNPVYVLRNYLAQQAINKAEAGDAGMVTELLNTMRQPYEEQVGKEQFAEKRPEWARDQPGCSMLSCSS